MTHAKFTGVTFNDIEPFGIRISRSLEFSVVNSAEITLNIPHRVHIFTRTWLHDVSVFAIANRLSVICLAVVCLSLMFVRPTQGVEAFGDISLPLCTLAIVW